MLKKKIEVGELSFNNLIVVSVSLPLSFFLGRTVSQIKFPWKKRLGNGDLCAFCAWRCSQVNTWKGRGGGRMGQEKAGCDTITTDTSAQHTGSSGAWMALQRGSELRNKG